MRNSLDKEKGIVLYGAGQKSHSTYKALIMSGYTVVYCVVSGDFVKESEFEDIKVYPFSEKKEDIIKNKYQIVIASFQRYEDEIADNIINNGINSFWRTSEMPWSADFEAYRNLGKKEYMKIIRDKYFSNTEKYAKNELLQNYIEKSIKQDITNKKITFLVLSARPRSYKIIEALHRKGYYVNLLMWINALNMTLENYREFNEISDECRICADVEEVMLYCAATNSKILHIFSDPNVDIELSQILINCKDVFPKIVFDEYDIVADLFRTVPNSVINAELFCLKHADGLCNRYNCMEYLEEKGHDICKKRILFMDCCNDFANFESPQREPDDDLQMVHIGTVYADRAYQVSRAGRLLEFGLLCKENRVHLHIYPISYDAAKMHAYIDMEKENPYFHLHYPVSARELAQEISQYDYGVLNANEGFLEYAYKEGPYTKEQFLYCSANRHYDFLDAGLPIVAAVPVEQTKMFEKDGVLIRKVDEEIDFEELRERRNMMKKKVIEVREKYKISHQLPTLIEFYDSL